MYKRGQVVDASPLNKRGQVTVFIIIGILILAVFAGALYLNKYVLSEKLESEEKPLTETAPFKLFIENCLKKSMIDGLYLVFSQGGYYQYTGVDLFRFAEEERLLELPYYFRYQKKIPSLERIESETEKASEVFFEKCVDGFKIFEQSGYQVEEKIINTAPADKIIEITFTDQAILGELNLPLEVTRDKQVLQLEKFSSKIDFSVPKKYNLIDSYLIKQESSPNYFLAGDLSSAAFDNDFDWSFEQYQDDGSDILINLNFPEKLKSEPLVYSFAMNYDWTGLGEYTTEPAPAPPINLKNYPIILDITKSGIATYSINAIGNDLTYTIYTDEFKIGSKTGLIELNTYQFENEEYLYYVNISDIDKNELLVPIYININTNPGNLPIMESIGDQIAEVGKEFYYQVKAQNPVGKDLFFSGDVYLFDIDKQTGEIRFTPKLEDRGYYDIRIDVENEYGKTWQRFELEVR